MIGLGDTVKDKLTGFEGVITATTQYLAGGYSCEVTSDGGSVEQGFDISQLDLLWTDWSRW